MPPYGNPSPADDSAMYSDQRPGERPPEDKPPRPEGAPTAMLDKSVFAGKDIKAGDEIVLKVLEVHDKDCTVAYSNGSKKDKPSESEPPQPPDDSASMSMYG